MVVFGWKTFQNYVSHPHPSSNMTAVTKNIKRVAVYLRNLLLKLLSQLQSNIGDMVLKEYSTKFLSVILAN